MYYYQVITSVAFKMKLLFSYSAHYIYFMAEQGKTSVPHL